MFKKTFPTSNLEQLGDNSFNMYAEVSGKLKYLKNVLNN